MARKTLPASPDSTMTVVDALERANAHWNAGQLEQAESLCQRVLAVLPDQPDALHILGLIAHTCGNLDLAIGHLRKACLSPRVPALYLSNLAEMCRQKGALSNAEDAARRAVALDAGLVQAWGNLGIILQEMGQLEESAACLERVVAAQPEAATAHNNLANTYSRLGSLEKARAHYMRALELRPDYAEAQSNLASLLNQLGQFEAAAEAARLAIDLDPRLADAYVNLAGAEMNRMRLGEALRWVEALLSFSPLHGGGLAAKARILWQLDLMDDALATARRAVAASPQSSDTHNVLGQILQAMDFGNEALAAFDKAASLPGLPVAALANRAAALMEQGAMDAALAGFDAVIANHPRHVRSWANRVDLKRFAADDPDIDRMETLLTTTSDFNDQIALHFALGKAHLDAGQSGSAFAHFNEGNRMKRSTFALDIKASGRWMREIADTFSQSALEHLAGQGHPSDMPIFVLGMPRSGTSLIEQILASHPDVRGAGELLTMNRLASNLPGYPEGATGLTGEQLRQMGEVYLARLAPLAKGRRHVIDKMPANFMHAGLIRLVFPQARIIHCRRDAIDTCLSCYTRLFTTEQRFTYDLAELGQFYLDYQSLTDHWRAVLPASHFIEVDYEAVVDDLEGQARQLLAALNLPWDDHCLAFHKTSRIVRTASATQVRQPIYKSSVGRWKSYAKHLQPLLNVLERSTS
ncbi:tetratricopeptide repeat-containing sulfotransferase family protein [Cohaesibacter haloalkalitolerans]|uniref:tetratricopeptide repeat-containing sulfotransferase family protein n=1 Tax=Cohaesibacter haloalkalitolerans TaxID=1162980 RepID=UPI000E651D05|nr:tetratricopeptide repeat-containing sulfotransferase family protein [Cohaesibacter haloalkalitolerans]